MLDDEAIEEDDDISAYQKWMHEITCYEEEAEKWVERSKKIIRRYKDDRTTRDKRGSKYNILWSNVQTLLPAAYNSPPKPNIERRFKDDDDVGRVASQVLERSASYFLDKDNFDSIMRQAVLDRLLPGRGTAWVRYSPTFRDAAEVTDDVEVEQELDSEEVCIDYVHWNDFGHTVAKTWEEVDAVWRIAYLDRDALIARFGEELGKEIPLDYVPKKLDGAKLQEAVNKAAIYEIWSKKTKEAYWLSKAHPTLLDEREDPLGLENFFPCPKPVYATLTNESLIPIPDYYEYQDQANELDELTARISQLTRAIKVAGVYDSSAQGVQRLLAEGVENVLIPVEQWAVFAEKGGIKGVMDFMPMKEIMETLLGLYEARDKVKADLYEITGMSDIIRGGSNPDETATAQQIKGQYASLRLNYMQKDIARFSRDLVRLITEIVAEHFSLDTIKNISGVKCLTEQEKQMLQMQYAPPMPGQPLMPPKEMPEEVQEQLEQPSWEQVEGLIRNQEIRCYRIDIETDSTIKADEEAEKAARVEFLTAAGGFIKEAAQVQNPDIQPLLMEMLMFGVRSFKAGRDLEGEFEIAMKKLKKSAENPAPPQPSPEMLQMQADQQNNQAKMQMADQQHQMEMAQRQQEQQTQAQIEQHKNEMEAQRANLEMQHDAQLASDKLHADMQLAQYKADLDAANDEKLALLNYQLDMQKLDADKSIKIAESGFVDPAPIVNGILEKLGSMADKFESAAKAHSSPKLITLDNGRTAKVEPVRGD